MATHIHVERTTTEKLETVLEGECLADVELFPMGGRDWTVVIEHDHDALASPAEMVKPTVNDRAPAWFVYVWDKLAGRRIIDIEFLQEHLDPPRWLIDYLEAPVLGGESLEVDTRVEALRRIYDLTRSGSDLPRPEWALEVVGEIRGLAASQIL